MSAKQKILFAILAAVCALLLAVTVSSGAYPCGVAEFAPDVPQHIKEQCRKQRRMGR